MPPPNQRIKFRAASQKDAEITYVAENPREAELLACETDSPVVLRQPTPEEEMAIEHQRMLMERQRASRRTAGPPESPRKATADSRPAR